MKKNLRFLTAALILVLTSLLISSSILAQSPEKMSFQAIVRDANDQLLSSQSIGIQISILQGTADGTAVYVETQTPNTNANGLVSIEIGTGTTTDDFSAINWANGPYFIKTETDPAGGTSYAITGTSQLLSVPYALYANTVENADDADADPENEIQILSLSGKDITISDGNTITLPTSEIDLDADPTNEIQDISLSGTDLSIANGSTVDLSIIQDGTEDDDADPTNELQVLSIMEDTIFLSQGGLVKLPAGDFNNLVNKPEITTTPNILIGPGAGENTQDNRYVVAVGNSNSSTSSL